MVYTHDFKLEVGDYTFKGDCEYTNAGLLSFAETSNDLMPERVKEAVRTILELLGPLPAEYTDLKTFKVSIKE